MKQRNIVVCILLSLVTCGIYGIYWMIVLNDETNALSGRQGTSGGLVFPVLTDYMRDLCPVLDVPDGQCR